MDRISREHRSWNMSRIRGKDTVPEIRVRKMLHQMGYRFRLHRKDLPGRPDIVLPRYATIIFVHGCYWHRHEGCRFAYTPKTRIDFWTRKFAENEERDRRYAQELTRMGWRVAVIWECETQDADHLVQRLSTILPGTPRKSVDRNED